MPSYVRFNRIDHVNVISNRSAAQRLRRQKERMPRNEEELSSQNNNFQTDVIINSDHTITPLLPHAYCSPMPFTTNPSLGNRCVDDNHNKTHIAITASDNETNSTS